MENKNKTLLYVVGVLLVIGVGISLAYFTASILANGDGAKTRIKTANIGDTTVTTEGNVEFEDLNIYPGHKNISYIKITATGNQEVEFNLIWKGINTLQTSLNYTIYKSTTEENPRIVCEKKSEGINTKKLFEECVNSNFENLEEKGTGVIASTEEETVFKLKENEVINATEEGTIVYYYVVLELPNIDDNQNYDANGRFSGETNIEVPNAKKVPTDKGIDDIIATLNVKSGTPDFTQVATGAETEENNGIYKTSDPMYITDDNPNPETYYWRGAATTNHVIFANKCWRIIRINGDKTIRLIYNGEQSETGKCQTIGDGSTVVSSSDSEKYYATADGAYNNPSYVGWTYIKSEQRPSTNVPQTSGTDSNAKIQTEKWYKTNIIDKGYDGKVATGKFCNERNVGQPVTSWNWGSSHYVTTWTDWKKDTSKFFAYAGAKRLYESYQPTLSCSNGDIYHLKVGAITADEVEYVGGKNENNIAYYLFTGTSYWTMSPRGWNSDVAGVLFIDTNGFLYNGNVHANDVGLRPVINLVSDVRFALDGNGTMESPYVVVEDAEA